MKAADRSSCLQPASSTALSLAPGVPPWAGAQGLVIAQLRRRPGCCPIPHTQQLYLNEQEAMPKTRTGRPVFHRLWGVLGQLCCDGCVERLSVGTMNSPFPWAC